MNNSNFNLILAVVLSIVIIAGWQFFVEKPRLAAFSHEQQKYNTQMDEIKDSSASTTLAQKVVDRDDALLSASRVRISTPHVQGSISLKGLRFDDLTLVGYKQNLTANAKDFALLSPSSTHEAYFATLGWHGDSRMQLPNNNTIWKADSDRLEVNDKVTFSWKNSDNIEFVVKVFVDHNYMFSIEQTTINHSKKPIEFQPYGIISRVYESNESANAILHEGLIAGIDGKLEDMTFEKVKDKKHEAFKKTKINWIGITDKYWLTAFVPDGRYKYNANYIYAVQNSHDRYQIDFIGDKYVLDVGKSVDFSTLFFAGAKKVNLLDEYSQKYDIELFDRAIDFGMFYILTKPLFHAMNFFYDYCGNFGVSILIVTVLIKLLMFGIANKSYRSMKKMKTLQPQVERIKELYSDDKAKFNQEIMDLYKREKVNPVSGCLPLLIQIPVFFSIYKVLYVTIEMRHAPFFGWIRDLSGPDPTTIFNLFGLIDFSPPGFLMIGAWPLLMGLTMYLQQKMSPEPADPVQAQVMKFMPLLFLFMFSRFPAGLLIYWAWNNILSIIQQYYINKLDKA
jgi:YidC/Oxa1 family membrane protein insertase